MTKKKQNARSKRANSDWAEFQKAMPGHVKDLWKLFSQFIRLRDCIKTTGSVYKGRCVTCGRVYNFGKLQAGHFVPGRATSMLFDEDCVHAQCYRCNVVLGGNWPPYYKFMQQEYGQEMIEYFINSVDVQIELSAEWVEEMSVYYKHKNQLMRNTLEV